MKYRKQTIEMEAMTFDELVAYGKNQVDVNIVEGMPWSFSIKGVYGNMPVTHENDKCYIVGDLHFTTDDILLLGISGEIEVCRLDELEMRYKEVNKKIGSITMTLKLEADEYQEGLKQLVNILEPYNINPKDADNIADVLKYMTNI